MAPPISSRLPFGKSRRKPVVLDDLGGTADGALAIVTEDGHRIHMSPPRVTSSLRYFLARVQDDLPRRLAMTSALRGEGVSYVTRSLAAVIAYDTDVSVAIVDLNWTRPKLPAGSKADSKAAKADSKAETKAAKAESRATTKNEATADEKAVATADAKPTLVNAVEDGVPVDDIIERTTNPRLSLVASGPVSLARRPAMAGSRALEQVIGQIAERFDHVLLDLPPVLASSDAITLSQLADAFVLIIRQGATAATQVEAALEEMRGGEALGVVLNRSGSDVPRMLRRLAGA